MLILSSTPLPPVYTHAPSNHTILNDTSLTAVTTSEGNRHLFFQEESGIIRQSIFTPLNGKWSAPTTYVVATDARLYTPMSAIQVPQNMTPDLDASRSEQVKLTMTCNCIDFADLTIRSTYSTSPSIIV